jgi:hypothetical protein
MMPGGGGNKGGWGGGGQNSFGHIQNKPPYQAYGDNNNMPMGQGQGGQGPSQGGFKDKNNDIMFSLCRNFHLGQACQYGDNCKKKHYFIANDENAIRRFNFMRNIPTSPNSKLSKFRSGNKDYFVLRNGNVINFFEFNFETKALSDVFNWPLPDLPANLKYNYYDHKGEYIYYSYPNPQTLIEDMGIFHIPTQKAIHIANSHSGRITGMAHFNDNVLLTTSVAGELKVWLKDGETYATHAESTERLRASFNPQNLKLELLFLDISEVSGTKIIAVGTNDGRLLFFIGNELSFNQVVFKEEAYVIDFILSPKYTACDTPRSPATPPPLALSCSSGIARKLSPRSCRSTSTTSRRQCSCRTRPGRTATRPPSASSSSWTATSWSARSGATSASTATPIPRRRSAASCTRTPSTTWSTARRSSRTLAPKSSTCSSSSARRISGKALSDSTSSSDLHTQ